ncbi:DUF6051 family protein [Ulvibacterium sp.]|uniref:DUF6051 family protein n=1 Tax=Ulvibacterium sp. TaxID=2665914 RepID=UPI00262130A0|nr:DUF6051 family protein [Ulvibacterium sp.]
MSPAIRKIRPINNEIEIKRFQFESTPSKGSIKASFANEGDVEFQDMAIAENNLFYYSIVSPKETLIAKKVIFLFHGLNEKSWKKYLPWAEMISEGTGSSVVLFPIAFHMQRVPRQWKDRENMEVLSRIRKRTNPGIHTSSPYNASLSERIAERPQRFMDSGIRTYNDVIRFIETCKDGQHSFIHKDFTFNIFAYSIGGYLAQMLKFTNYQGYFTHTKVCLFCSGSTLDSAAPISKFILDSSAEDKLRDYFKGGEVNDIILSSEHQRMDEMVLRSFYQYNHMRGFREAHIKAHCDYLYVIALKKDDVIPADAVVRTMGGQEGNLGIKVDVLDFERDYTHEIPFSLNHDPMDGNDEDMVVVFNKVNNFFNS